MENKKFSVGDMVRFKDEEQSGVGTIVAIDGDLHLVYSQEIRVGHDGMCDKFIQGNSNNWWFHKRFISSFGVHEEIPNFDYKKEYLKLRIKGLSSNYRIRDWKIYKGFITCDSEYNNSELFDFLDELKSLGYTIQEIVAEYELQHKVNDDETE